MLRHMLSSLPPLGLTRKHRTIQPMLDGAVHLVLPACGRVVDQDSAMVRSSRRPAA
jgi:hypothetical protein